MQFPGRTADGAGHRKEPFVSVSSDQFKALLFDLDKLVGVLGQGGFFEEVGMEGFDAFVDLYNQDPLAADQLAEAKKSIESLIFEWQINNGTIQNFGLGI